MSACSEAFHTLRPCAILVVGVAGSMPAHGIGTACFVASTGGKEQIVKIHNCLLCHGEDKFNLLSVSQTLRSRRNEIVFSAEGSRIRVKGSEGQEDVDFALHENDGLYELVLSPLYLDDPRLGSLPYIEMTMDDDQRLWNEGANSIELMNRKAPTKLGVWHSKVLWIGTRKMGLQRIEHEYDDTLNEFCDSYLVPPSQPAARRTYRSGETSDMAELSLRFMGIGTDRLEQTLKRSRGLTPPSKEKGENKSIVPPEGRKDTTSGEGQGCEP